jgi:predicted transcriptional regulator
MLHDRDGAASQAFPWYKLTEEGRELIEDVNKLMQAIWYDQC